LDPRLLLEPPEEPDPGLVEHDHFSVCRGHAELVEGVLGRLLHGLARHFYPFH
jgi:hypothetical protein